MTTLDKFQEVAKINFVGHHGDIQLGEWMTRDGYDLYVVTQNPSNLDFENEVWYYKPGFDDIMSEINYLRPNGEPVDVEVYDVDEWFDEYDMLNYLESEMDEDEFDEFTNE